MAFRFEVDHVEHDGNIIATFKPYRLQWMYQLGQFGAGTIYYEIPLLNEDVTADGWAAKRTDWILYCVTEPDGTRWPIHAGIHAPSNLNPDKSQTVSVTGMDWLAWLENPYPWDYTETMAAKLAEDLDSTFWKRWNANDGDTLQDVVAELIGPLTENEDEQVVIVPDYIGTAWTETTDYTVTFGDGTPTRQHLAALASMADPRGFDMRMSWDKVLYLTGPRTIDPDDVDAIYSLTGPSDGIVLPDWTNHGPNAANTVVIATGTGNTRNYSYKTYAPTVTEYRDWTIVRQLNAATSDLTDDDGIDDSATAGAYQDRHPQKELRLTIKPDRVDPSDEIAMFYNQTGQAINVDYTYPGEYHRIDADFYITSQQFYSDDAGNWLCDLTLDQVYA